MGMNFIDISSWQKGLDLKALCDKNPALDGVIVKATEGTSYFNPYCDNWIKTAQEIGKPWGYYHFLTGGDPIAEANYFWTHTHNYFGHGLPCVDYEETAANVGTAYLKKFLDRIFELSNVKPIIYCPQWMVEKQDFAAIASAGYGLWVKQYADNELVYGFVDKPWHKGSVAPFHRFVMQQYTSCGRLDGWDGNLDFDRCYISYAEWLEMARGKHNSTPEARPVDTAVVSDVLHGKYGIGEERVQKLTEAGYDAKAVQNKINELYAIAQSCKRYIDGNLEFLNSIDWIIKCL